MRCMHARPYRRKGQLPLRWLRDLRSRLVFAPVRPGLARWEYKRPRKGPRCTKGNGDISERLRGIRSNEILSRHFLLFLLLN